MQSGMAMRTTSMGSCTIYSPDLRLKPYPGKRHRLQPTGWPGHVVTCSAGQSDQALHRASFRQVSLAMCPYGSPNREFQQPIRAGFLPFFYYFPGIYILMLSIEYSTRHDGPSFSNVKFYTGQPEVGYTKERRKEISPAVSIANG